MIKLKSILLEISPGNKDHDIESDGTHVLLAPQSEIDDVNKEDEKGTWPTVISLGSNGKKGSEKWSSIQTELGKSPYKPYSFKYNTKVATKIPCLHGKPTKILSAASIVSKMQQLGYADKILKIADNKFNAAKSYMRSYYTIDKLEEFLKRNPSRIVRLGPMDSVVPREAKKIHNFINMILDKMKITPDYSRDDSVYGFVYSDFVASFLTKHDYGKTTNAVRKRDPKAYDVGIKQGKGTSFFLCPLTYYWLRKRDPKSSGTVHPEKCAVNYEIELRSKYAGEVNEYETSTKIYHTLVHEMNHVVYAVIEKYLSSQTIDISQADKPLDISDPNYKDWELQDKKKQDDLEYILTPTEQFSRLNSLRSILGITSQTPWKEATEIIYKALRGPESGYKLFNKSKSHPGLYYFNIPFYLYKEKNPDTTHTQWNLKGNWEPVAFTEKYWRYISKHTSPYLATKSNDVARLLANFVDFNKSKKESTKDNIRYYINLKNLAAFNNKIVQEPTDKAKDQVGDVGMA